MAIAFDPQDRVLTNVLDGAAGFWAATIAEIILVELQNKTCRTPEKYA